MERRRTYSALDIARYIVDYSREIGFPVDNLKLQKLLYFCQGFRLQYSDTPLFEEEIVAWRYGPVVPEVYSKYKMNGTRNIYSTRDIFNLRTRAIIDEEDKEEIQIIVDGFKHTSGSRLITITHNQRPWQNHSDVYNETIPKDEIADFFREEM